MDAQGPGARRQIAQTQPVHFVGCAAPFHVAPCVEQVHLHRIRRHNGFDLSGHSAFHNTDTGIIRCAFNGLFRHVGDKAVGLGKRRCVRRQEEQHQAVPVRG